MKTNFTIAILIILACYLLPVGRVSALDMQSVKIIENKGFFDRTPLSVRIKNDFPMSRFAAYFYPARYSVNNFNRSFLSAVYSLSANPVIKTIPVYGYFTYFGGTKRAAAQGFENR